MRKWLRYNGLSIAMFTLFAISLVGQVWAGHRVHNQDQVEHQQPTLSLGEYLASGHFIEAVFENWESEFLQMSAYVLLTVFLFQKGSSESKDPDRLERVDVIPAQSRREGDTPWPVRRGGWILRLYEHSLSLALVLLFAVSFVLHAIGGAEEYNQDQFEHGRGGHALSALEYIGTSRFWFE